MTKVIGLIILTGLIAFAVYMWGGAIKAFIWNLKQGGKIIWPWTKLDAPNNAAKTATNEIKEVQPNGVCSQGVDESWLTKSHPTDPPYTAPKGVDERLLFIFLYERAWKASSQFRDKKWNALIFPTIKNPGAWSYVDVQTEVQMKLKKYVMEEAARLKKDFQKTLPPAKPFDHGVKGESE
jgi:hypothetical protein